MSVLDSIKAYQAAVDAHNVAYRDAILGQQTYATDSGVQMVLNPVTGEFAPVDVGAAPTPDQYGLSSLGKYQGIDGVPNTWHEIFADPTTGNLATDAGQALSPQAGESQQAFVQRILNGINASAVSQAQVNAQHALSRGIEPMSLAIMAGNAALGGLAGGSIGGLPSLGAEIGIPNAVANAGLSAGLSGATPSLAGLATNYAVGQGMGAAKSVLGGITGSTPTGSTQTINNPTPTAVGGWSSDGSSGTGGNMSWLDNLFAGTDNPVDNGATAGADNLFGGTSNLVDNGTDPSTNGELMALYRELGLTGTGGAAGMPGASTTATGDNLFAGTNNPVDNGGALSPAALQTLYKALGILGTGGAAGGGTAGSTGGPKTARDWISQALGISPGATSAVGTGLGALADLYGISQRQKQFDSLTAMGAPSRARYEASFAPGFTMASDPGYTDALNASAKGFTNAASATFGNPANSPNAWAQTLSDLNSKFAYPALQNYRNTNAQGGGLASFNNVAANSVNSAADPYKVIGQAATNIFSPTDAGGSLAELLKKYGGAASNIFSVAQ